MPQLATLQGLIDAAQSRVVARNQSMLNEFRDLVLTTLGQEVHDALGVAYEYDLQKERPTAKCRINEKPFLLARATDDPSSLQVEYFGISSASGPPPHPIVLGKKPGISARDELLLVIAKTA